MEDSKLIAEVAKVDEQAARMGAKALNELGAMVNGLLEKMERERAKLRSLLPPAPAKKPAAKKAAAKKATKPKPKRAQ